MRIADAFFAIAVLLWIAHPSIAQKKNRSKERKPVDVNQFEGTWQLKNDTCCFTVVLYRCTIERLYADYRGVCGMYSYELKGKQVYNSLDMRVDTLVRIATVYHPIKATPSIDNVDDRRLFLIFSDRPVDKVTTGYLEIKDGKLVWSIRPIVEQISATINGKSTSPIYHGWSVPVKATLTKIK